jgi:peptidoglycan-associated lipoprotein
VTHIKTRALLIVAAALLGACSSTPLTPPAPVAQATPAPAPAPAPAAPAPKPAPAPGVAPVTLPAHLDPKSLISTERSVYFDFDDYSIKQQYTPLIERHGKYLASNPALAIKIEGNADERGSREYNLALGQRRAEAVLRALKIYGAKDAQMEAISWGKEKPVALGHDEEAWAQNRRADLQYPKR